MNNLISKSALLKNTPKRIEKATDYAKGWNDCIDEIIWAINHTPAAQCKSCKNFLKNEYCKESFFNQKPEYGCVNWKAVKNE